MFTKYVHIHAYIHTYIHTYSALSLHGAIEASKTGTPENKTGIPENKTGMPENKTGLPETKNIPDSRKEGMPELGTLLCALMEKVSTCMYGCMDVCKKCMDICKNGYMYGYM
jgi:hypothetical protein